ncbi:GerMN domain-containing protein [Plectonema radiosum NIES-515]|uniref:GerMN domain-containing protein n=1 Tax=Plectonema radiosum NIES-515 TaxID=2986073 RepID=A0ABT3AUP7_9CYAN|nr:GerMN domain-containing protein [Plectonema radiosum]MCV3212851.1 GerMN domain-containing protein [Plectonema radiosum NIES-515]
MKDQQGSKRISSGVIAAVSAAVIAVSGGVAWLTWNANHSGVPTPAPTGLPNSGNTIPAQPVKQATNIYWLKDNGKNFEFVPQPVQVKAKSGNKPDQVLEAVFQSLLAGPTEGTGSTTIPKETKLESLKVQNDEIHVNLSNEFTSGGGSTSMIGRVGQVVYTATTLNPTAKVYIDVNGKKLETLGGEGLEVEQPLTRESFNKDYSL